VRVSALELHWSGVGVFTRVCFSEGFFCFLFFWVCGEIMTSVVRNVGASFSSNSLLQISMSDQFCCDRLCVHRSRACCLGTINPKLLRDMISGSVSCVDFGGSSSLVGGWSSSSSSSSSSWGARRFGIQVRCSAPPPVAMPTTTSPHRRTSPKTRTQRIMEGISSENEAGGAGGSSSYQALKRMDEQWLRMRSMKPGKPATYDPLPVSEAFAQVFVFSKP
jgi:hypothetical protein